MGPTRTLPPWVTHFCRLSARGEYAQLRTGRTEKSHCRTFHQKEEGSRNPRARWPQWAPQKVNAPALLGYVTWSLRQLHPPECGLRSGSRSSRTIADWGHQGRLTSGGGTMMSCRGSGGTGHLLRAWEARAAVRMWEVNTPHLTQHTGCIPGRFCVFKP